MADTKITLPNIRTRIGGIRGQRDKLDPQRHQAQREIAGQTAEALTVVQDALDLLVRKLNETNTAVDTASPAGDDLVFELYDGTEI